LKKFVTRDLEI